MIVEISKPSQKKRILEISTVSWIFSNLYPVIKNEVYHKFSVSHLWAMPIDPVLLVKKRICGFEKKTSYFYVSHFSRKGVVHKLRLQIFGLFWPPLPP